MQFKGSFLGISPGERTLEFVLEGIKGPAPFSEARA